MSMETSRAWLMPVDSTAPGVARRLVERMLGPTDEMLLAVSELVSNAVRHGRGPIELHITVAAEAVDIEVVSTHTAGDAVPVVRSPSESPTPDGHGLRIVEEISESWAWSIAGARLTVRARLHR